MCCTRLAEKIQDAKKSPKIHHLGTIAQLCRAISSQLRHVSTIGKKLVKQQYLATCPYNMVNFGPLATEIRWRVWGNPRKFQRDSRLGSVTARHSSSGRQPNFAALSRRRHNYIRQGGHYVGHWPTFLVVKAVGILYYTYWKVLVTNLL